MIGSRWLPWRFGDLRGGAFASATPQIAPREWSPPKIGKILARHGVINCSEEDYAAAAEVWILQGILVRYQLLLARHWSLQAETAERRRKIVKRLTLVAGKMRKLAIEAQVLAQEYEALRAC
jgi:hypothetical protein